MPSTDCGIAPHADEGYELVARPTRTVDPSSVRTSRHIRIGLLAVLILACSLTVAGCSGHKSKALGDRCSRAATAATATTPRSDFDHLALQVPVGWYPVKVCLTTAISVVPLGFLTTQPPIAQCRPDSHGNIGCHAPIDRLGDNDALVSVNEIGGPFETFRPHTTIAGRPAQWCVARGWAAGGVPASTCADIMIGTNDLVRVTGYFGKDASALKQVVRRMIVRSTISRRTETHSRAAMSGSPLRNGTADHRTSSSPRRMLDKMTTSAGPRRHLATSPFQPDPEPIIEQYAIHDLVSHDSYGMGRVTQVEAAAVTVDFRSRKVRITSPFHKMTRL